MRVSLAIKNASTIYETVYDTKGHYLRQCKQAKHAIYHTWNCSCPVQCWNIPCMATS